MAKPTGQFAGQSRSVEDLVGKRVVTSGWHWASKKNKISGKYREYVYAIIDRVRTNKSGEITGIYVRRANEIRRCMETLRPTVINWRKTRKLISDPAHFNPPIHRVRREVWDEGPYGPNGMNVGISYDPKKFAWKWELARSPFCIGKRVYLMARQNGSGGQQWRYTRATIGWFLNNEQALPVEIHPRVDMGGDQPDDSQEAI